MSSGIDFMADVFLKNMYFSNAYQVEVRINENDKSIEDAKKRIQMFVSASPKDIIDPEWKEQPIDWLVNSTDPWFEVITDAVAENVRLYLYIDYLESVKEKEDEDETER